MDLIPAIDLKEGQCVRLRQGRMDDATVFSSDPVAMARHWAEQGARRLHIVDLDGAFAGEPKNRTLVEAMVAAVGQVPVQLGGGVRSEEIAQAYFEAGVARLIVGTRAIEEPEFLLGLAQRFPHRILLGLDARNGMLATAGWDETKSVSAVEFVRNLGEVPLAGIVYTDIDRDGMLQGLNVEATVALSVEAGIDVIASGGVHTLEDLETLSDAVKAEPASRISGAITGRAIYEETLRFAEGQALLDRLIERDSRQ